MSFQKGTQQHLAWAYVELQKGTRIGLCGEEKELKSTQHGKPQVHTTACRQQRSGACSPKEDY